MFLPLAMTNNIQFLKKTQTKQNTHKQQYTHTKKNHQTNKKKLQDYYVIVTGNPKHNCKNFFLIS